jgi:hypothetical protein
MKASTIVYSMVVAPRSSLSSSLDHRIRYLSVLSRPHGGELLGNFLEGFEHDWT